MNTNAYNNGVATRQFITGKAGVATSTVKTTLGALTSWCQGLAKGPAVRATKAKQITSK